MATRPLPESAEVLYAPYIGELQEFFATSGLPCGSPEDIFAISERLRESQAFFEDMSSLVRSIILRQGGSMPHAVLLQILALAVGGAEMERAPQVYRQPLRHLLAFVTGVLRRPLNLPPDERAEVLSFPSAASTLKTTELPPQEPSLTEAAKPVSPLPDASAPAPWPPPPSLEIRFEPPAAEPEPPDAELQPLEMDDLPAIESEPFAIADPEPLAAEPAAPDPPILSLPPAHTLMSPSVRNLSLAGSAAAVFAIVLVVALHHYASIPPAAQPTEAAPAVPAASPTTSSATTPAPSPASIQPDPAADGAALTPSPTPATHRSSTASADSDYTAPPTYHSYIAASPAAPPATPPPAATSSQPATQAAATPDPEAASAAVPDTTRPANPSPEVADDLPSADRASSSVLADHPRYLEVSSGVMAANLISAPMPEYPALARMAHVQGQVILQAVISAGGSVSATRVLSGPRLLRGAAVDAVRRWRYRPYLIEGRPVDVSTIVTLTFHPAR